MGGKRFGIFYSTYTNFLCLQTPPNCKDEVICDPPQDHEKIIQKMPPVQLPKKVEDTLELLPSSHEWDKYALSSEQIRKYISIIDIVPCDSENSCCFTRGYTRCMERSGSVLSAKPGKIDSINELDSIAIQSLRLRFFTPEEVARLMTFPSSFSFPDGITLRQRYKALGNSINVFVVSLLISYLMKDEV